MSSKFPMKAAKQLPKSEQLIPAVKLLEGQPWLVTPRQKEDFEKALKEYEQKFQGKEK